MSKQRKTVAKRVKVADHRELPAYGDLVGGIAEVLEAARRASARAVNAVMTATYWEIGRRIVEHEQGGKERAEYGEAVLAQLSRDLTSRYGRGFGVDNLQRFRLFYVAYASIGIYATASRKSPAQPTGKHATLPRISGGEPLTQIAARFPLPWSAYVRLLAVKNEKVLAAEYRTVLPDEKLIAADLQKTQRMLERRGTAERGTAMKSQR